MSYEKVQVTKVGCEDMALHLHRHSFYLAFEEIINDLKSMNFTGLQKPRAPQLQSSKLQLQK